MELTEKEQSAEGQEILTYLDEQPDYVQPLVTDCIVEGANLFMSADMFDAQVEQWLIENRPEKLHDYRTLYALTLELGASNLPYIF